MLMKTKDSKLRMSHKRETLEIRCRVNLLPAKSLLYALSYVNGRAQQSKNSQEMILNMGRARRSVRVLNNVVDRLRSNRELDPKEMHDIISIASSAYVNLYYSMDANVMKGILDEYGVSWKSRLPKEANLITMPAIMFNRNEAKNKVISNIKRSIYKKPFWFLYSAIESSKRIETLQISMALKKPTDYGMNKLAYSISALGRKVGEIEKGIIKPDDDEALKVEILNGLFAISELHNIHTISYINWKLDETSFSIKAAQRVSRQ